MADYTLYNSIDQIDRTISGAYQALIVAGTGICRVVSPPSTSNSPGISGYNIAADENYLYFCIGADQWKRIALESF